MNIVIAVGVLVDEPIIKKMGTYYQTQFKIATLEDDMLANSPTYLNCVAFGEVGYHIYNRFKKGMPLCIRGRLLYNYLTNQNTVRVLYAMGLKSTNSEIYMDMQEFLDIYNPEKAVKEMQKEIKESKMKPNDNDNNVG